MKRWEVAQNMKETLEDIVAKCNDLLETIDNSETLKEENDEIADDLLEESDLEDLDEANEAIECALYDLELAEEKL